MDYDYDFDVDFGYDYDYDVDYDYGFDVDYDYDCDSYVGSIASTKKTNNSSPTNLEIVLPGAISKESAHRRPRAHRRSHTTRLGSPTNGGIGSWFRIAATTFGA